MFYPRLTVRPAGKASLNPCIEPQPHHDHKQGDEETTRGRCVHGHRKPAAVAVLAAILRDPPAPVPPSENTSPTGWTAGPRARSARRRRPRWPVRWQARHWPTDLPAACRADDRRRVPRGRATQDSGHPARTGPVAEVRAEALHAVACDRCKRGSCRPAAAAVLLPAIAILGTDASPRVRAMAVVLDEPRCRNAPGPPGFRAAGPRGCAMPAPGGGRLHRAKDGGCSRGSVLVAARRPCARQRPCAG